MHSASQHQSTQPTDHKAVLPLVVTMGAIYSVSTRYNVLYLYANLKSKLGNTETEKSSIKTRLGF